MRKKNIEKAQKFIEKWLRRLMLFNVLLFCFGGFGLILYHMMGLQIYDFAISWAFLYWNNMVGLLALMSILKNKKNFKKEKR